MPHSSATERWLDVNCPGVVYTPEQIRCVEVLTHWKALYNINPIGRVARPDKGFRPIGTEAIEVRVRDTFATHDFDELTRFVLAAHQLCCRVQISAGPYNCLKVFVSAREPEAESNMLRHPGLTELAGRIEARRRRRMETE